MPITVTSRAGAAARRDLPAFGVAVKNSNAKVPKVRPGRDLLRPYGRGDQLRRDDKSVPALPVADQLGKRRERGSALAGAERRDQQGRRRARTERLRRVAGTNAGREGGRGRSLGWPPAALHRHAAVRSFLSSSSSSSSASLPTPTLPPSAASSMRRASALPNDLGLTLLSSPAASIAIL